MIDSSDITKFDRTDAELEEFWLFCLVVAGKTAITQARLLQYFLDLLVIGREDDLDGLSPFDRIALAETISPFCLKDTLIKSRLGQYNRLERSFRESLSLSLRKCSIHDLENIFGVGPKTARLFLMHSRPNQRLAAIDTHILKLLREEGIAAPKVTPSAGKIYDRLEQEFLKLADAVEMSPADYDLQVWKRFSFGTSL